MSFVNLGYFIQRPYSQTQSSRLLIREFIKDTIYKRSFARDKFFTLNMAFDEHKIMIKMSSLLQIRIIDRELFVCEFSLSIKYVIFCTTTTFQVPLWQRLDRNHTIVHHMSNFYLSSCIVYLPITGDCFSLFKKIKISPPQIFKAKCISKRMYIVLSVLATQCASVHNFLPFFVHSRTLFGLLLI